MTDLAPFAHRVALDHGLSVVVTLRADHTHTPPSSTPASFPTP
jgi:hypothetical protein